MEGCCVGLGGSSRRPGNLYFDKPQRHVGHRPLPTNTCVIELLPAETALALQSPRRGAVIPQGTQMASLSQSQLPPVTWASGQKRVS